MRGLYSQLTEHAENSDRSTDWPVASWNALRDAGGLEWSVPSLWGGVGWPSHAQLKENEALAGACATTAFILSQRDAAVRWLVKGPDHLQKRFLPGSRLLTVGLSQLTTSKQAGGTALRASPEAGGYRLDGVIPWVTAADRAEIIVAGATLADGSELLCALPPNRAGVFVEPPMTLAALSGSRTARVRCEGVRVEAEDILAGPFPQVLGGSGGGGLETSCLAIGVAAASICLIPADAEDVRDRLAASLDLVRARLHAAAMDPADLARTLSLRVDATSLALQTTQAALLLAKGTGFVAPHPAQRLARQAHFFLVWSLPKPAAEAVLAALLVKGVSP